MHCISLSYHRGSREERSARSHLVENAAHAPHINRGGVLGGAQQHVRRPVPEGHHLIIILIVPGLLTTLRLTFQSDAELGLVSDEIPCQGNLGEKCS